MLGSGRGTEESESDKTVNANLHLSPALAKIDIEVGEVLA